MARSNRLILYVGILVVSIFLLFWIRYLFLGGSSNGSIGSSQEAIEAVQARYGEVAGIEIILTPEPFKSEYVIVHDRDYGWDIIFYKGEGDCPSGCIDNYFWYFSVDQDGTITKEGEYSRVFDAGRNDFDETGSPLWGYPK